MTDGGASTAQPRSAHHPSLILGSAAPNAIFLVCLECELQARTTDFARVAHRFRGPDYTGRDSGTPNREEQLRTRELATCPVAPTNVRTTDWSRPDVLTHNKRPLQSWIAGLPGFAAGQVELFCSSAEPRAPSPTRSQIGIARLAENVRDSPRRIENGERASGRLQSRGSQSSALRVKVGGRLPQPPP
jgi:hypothetical protein